MTVLVIICGYRFALPFIPETTTNIHFAYSNPVEQAYSGVAFEVREERTRRADDSKLGKEF